MRRMEAVVLVGLLQVAGVTRAFAADVSVLIVSDPPGASLLAADGERIVAPLPVTRSYMPPEPWGSCVTFQGFKVRWPSGAEVLVGRIELCPEDGSEQVVRVSLPATSAKTVAMPSRPSGVCRDGAVIYKPANGRCADGTPTNSPATAAAPIRSPDDRMPSQPTNRPSTADRMRNPQREGKTTVNVVVLDRRYSDTEYGFVVPGTINTYRASNANCFANTNGSLFATAVGNTVSGTINSSTSTNCVASGTSSTTVIPAQEVSYSVRGATFSLLLPDRRVAVVNCDSKVNWTEWSMNPRRSCRIPTVNRFDVEFNGDKAKLIWGVGINGEKVVSETYDLVQILDAIQP
jgi:hypothetical protein